jgi:hypothetical protein
LQEKYKSFVFSCLHKTELDENDSLTGDVKTVENGKSGNAGVTQLVECDLAKVDVAGSNPVSRSIPISIPKPGAHLHIETA